MSRDVDAQQTPTTPSGGGGAYELLRPAVTSILKQSPEAAAAHQALRDRGISEADAREQIARVLLAVMYHVGAESERVRAAGGGAGLRKEAFGRLAAGETAAHIFEGPTEEPIIESP